MFWIFFSVFDPFFEYRTVIDQRDSAMPESTSEQIISGGIRVVAGGGHTRIELCMHPLWNCETADCTVRVIRASQAGIRK